MRVPSKIHNIRLVQIQSEERLAAPSEQNRAFSLVTGCGEAKGTWRDDASPTGSKTVARNQMDIMETRDAQRVLLTGVCPIKPINGEIVQTTLCESDQLIVPEKQGNACRGKGLAGARWTCRDTPAIPRDGQGVSTKLWFITLQSRYDPTCKFTSLAHLLTADFLKECFWELKNKQKYNLKVVVVQIDDLYERIARLSI